MNFDNHFHEFISLLAVLTLISCTEVDSSTQSYNLTLVRKLHADQRDHHFRKDSLAFADQMSDKFVSVNGGYISRPTKEESVARYNRYFSSVEFEQWDDVTEPIIRFSDDSSMAYTIVDKLVVLTYPDSAGNTITDETHFAWTTVYTIYGDEWKIDCVTSTRRTEE